MKIVEFDHYNIIADEIIAAFNLKYAHKIFRIQADSNRKGKVIGLLKYLSLDVAIEFSKSFADKIELNKSDISKSKSIELFVLVDLITNYELVALDTFFKVNPNELYIVKQLEFLRPSGRMKINNALAATGE